MKCRLDKILLLSVAIVGAGLASWSAPAAGAAERASQLNMKLPANAKAAVTASQAMRALPVEATCQPGKLAVNDEVSRGWVSKIYAKIAPATVLISCGDGLGSGFLISPDGWIITNHHVIEDAPITIETGGLVATVYLGTLGEDGMELDRRGIKAHVFKTSEDQDLALLKLTELPDEVDKLPYLEPADSASVERGTRCVVIGHPKAGMLWTVRSGEVANIGTWPDDRIPAVMAQLAATGERQEELTEVLAGIPKRRIVISSCGINPGDSGGPLVNDKGEVIGVSFAFPKGGTDEGYSLDKFSYHLHIKEVKDFLDEVPDEPEPYVPDPWKVPALVSSLIDKDDNQKWDLVAFGVEEGGPPTGFLIDLDQDSPQEFDLEDLADEEKRTAWEFEFAMQCVPLFRTFYDTNNDGQIDVSLTDADEDGVADIVLKIEDGTWKKIDAEDQSMIDADLFEDEAIRQRFVELVVKPFQKAVAGEEPEEPGEESENPQTDEPTKESENPKAGNPKEEYRPETKGAK